MENNYDTQTGLPIQNNQEISNNNQLINDQSQAIVNNVEGITPPIEQNINNNAEIIPTTTNNEDVFATVEQSKQEFINNTQTAIQPIEEKKKSEISYPILIVCFILIFLIIFFVFPLISKYI